MSDTCLVQSVPPRQSGFEFDLLGSLEVSRAGRPVEFGSAKERALLAILVLRLGEVVSIDSLIDVLWGAQLPADPLGSLHVLISRLRKALGADCIVTRGRGYALSVDAESIDLVRFERLLASGRASLAAGDAREAASTLRRALALWRGEPLADLPPEQVVEAERHRLGALRWAALEARIDADLALGEHAALLPELEYAVREHPVRERSIAQLMLAQYRCGRQSEALETYRLARSRLVETLGLEPGSELQQLERKILQHAPSLAAPGQARPTLHRQMRAVETRYARSGDVSIAYQVAGEGPFDVVFIFGWVSHVEMAWHVPAYRGLFERLGSFARLIIFDKRGTGMSDRPQGAPTLETRMDDVRVVMDAAGSERAAIIGMSDGAPMSLLFAATYPDRTRALVLFGGLARTLWAPDYPWGWTEAALQDSADEWVQSAEPGYYEQVAHFVSPDASDDEHAALATFLRYGATPSAADAADEMNLSIDVREVLPTISVPALVLHCAGDPLCPVGGGRHLAERIPGAAYVEVPGRYHVPSVAEAGVVADEFERFLLAVWDKDGWAEVEHDRVLATILYTDILGPTSRLPELGDAGWKGLMDRYRALVRRQLLRYRGRELDVSGDGLFASFDGPARGIRCAGAISDAARELGLAARAGLHTGECHLVDGKIGGIAVHIGARVAGEAKAGEVLVSGTVKDLVVGSGIEFEDRGMHELKGVPGEWHLFVVEHA